MEEDAHLRRSSRLLVCRFLCPAFLLSPPHVTERLDGYDIILLVRLHLTCGLLAGLGRCLVCPHWEDVHSV
jgi:hypothetical protein